MAPISSRALIGSSQYSTSTVVYPAGSSAIWGNQRLLPYPSSGTAEPQPIPNAYDAALTRRLPPPNRPCQTTTASPAGLMATSGAAAYPPSHAATAFPAGSTASLGFQASVEFDSTGVAMPQPVATS